MLIMSAMQRVVLYTVSTKLAQMYKVRIGDFFSRSRPLYLFKIADSDYDD